MKGSNKEFARYLAFEYNDEYLQPADDYDPYDEEDISEFLSRQETKLKKEPEPPKPEEDKLASKNNPGKTLKQDAGQIHLSRSYISDLTYRLEQPARDCANNIAQIHSVEDVQVLDAFKKFHQAYEILPVIFCSYMPEQAVCLWQINRYGPIDGENPHKMVVNAGPKASKIGRYISFLLLAKITCIGNEKIIDTKLFEDNQLIVISQTGDRELIFRLYNVKDFAEIARVNPFNQEILANTLYSFKLSIKGYKNPDGSSYNLEITSSRVQTTEEFAAEAAANPNSELVGKEIIVQKIVLEGYPYIFSALKSDFSDIFRISKGVIVLTDRDSSTVVAWGEADIIATHHDFGVIKSLKYGHDSVYISTRVDHLVNYELDFGEYPEIKIKEICVPTPSEIQMQIQNYASEAEKQRELIKSFMEPKSRNGEKFPILVPNIPFTLDIPKDLRKAHQESAKAEPEKSANNNKDEKTHEDEEEKKEEICLSDKVDKIRNRLALENSGKPSLEGTKEMLKEIREDVRAKKKELTNYDKLVKEENEKKSKYWYNNAPPDQKLVKPNDVPKESYHLYNQVKEEKKKIRKDREKEKDRKKKERSSRDHDI